MEDTSLGPNSTMLEFLYKLEFNGDTFTYYKTERNYFVAIKKELGIYVNYEPDLFYQKILFIC